MSIPAWLVVNTTQLILALGWQGAQLPPEDCSRSKPVTKVVPDQQSLMSATPVLVQAVDGLPWYTLTWVNMSPGPNVIPPLFIPPGTAPGSA